MHVSKIMKMTFCAAIVALGAGQANAQEAATITLKSLDGNVVMIGELQGFEAGFYSIVVSGLGLLSIAEGLVTCESSSVDCAALVSNS